jgi:multidrug efflux pump subunit AcrA (membrane-fusion protein)
MSEELDLARQRIADIEAKELLLGQALHSANERITELRAVSAARVADLEDENERLKIECEEAAAKIAKLEAKEKLFAEGLFSAGQRMSRMDSENAKLRKDKARLDKLQALKYCCFGLQSSQFGYLDLTQIEANGLAWQGFSLREAIDAMEGK